MLRGHSPGWPLSTATHRTPEADGLLCALLATHHMPHDLSRYIAYSAHVSIQLDESEHVDVPEHWFNIYFELHAACPHGAMCD